MLNLPSSSAAREHLQRLLKAGVATGASWARQAPVVLRNITRARPDETRSLHALRRHVVAGGALCAFLFVGVGGWAATAELAGAVIAPGSVVVDTNLKKVQHPTGGVIGELRVKDGDEVRRGDILVRLDETVTRANLAAIVKLLDEYDGQHARLEAERDGAEQVTFPGELLQRAESDPDVRRILNGQRTLFEARRIERAGQKAQLNERVAQLREEIDGLDAQRQSKGEQIKLIDSELKGVEELYKKNLVPIARLTSLQREAARLQGERGQVISAMAQAKGKIAETELQIIQLDQNMRTEVLKELREIETKRGEQAERRVTAEDQLKRIDIRSPQDGIIHQLAVHTVGGVIGPGETLMLVVPESDALTVEVKVAPQEIDHIAIGQPAVVRLSAFNQRTTPELNGTVTRVSADLTKDQQSGLSFYTARVELPDSELQRLRGHKLVPGMPAEVHVQTGTRSALSYMVKPFSDQIARAFKEQ